jgi:hypothetical protein
METESGKLTIRDNLLMFRSDHYGNWDCSIGEIAVIGELTNEDGPFAADWFLVFLKQGTRACFEAPVDAKGRSEVLSILQNQLGAIGEFGLASSTSFASRILWPLSLEGKPLFEWNKRGCLSVSRSLLPEVR